MSGMGMGVNGQGGVVEQCRGGSGMGMGLTELVW